MNTAFTRTVRALDADRFLRPGGALVVCLVFLGAWGIWAWRVPVTVREVSSAARIEVAGAAVPVQAPMAGRVARTLVVVGSMVKAGDAMLELDSSPERLQYQEEKTRAETVGPSVTALRAQVSALVEAKQREQEASRRAVEEARENQKSAEAPARYAAVEVARSEQLRKEGIIAEREYQKARSDAEQSRASADRQQLAADRLIAEQRTRESDRDAAVRNLESEIAKLEAQAASARAAMMRLENEMERRVVRAPFSGRVGEAEVLRVGGYVTAGEKVAAIVPESKLLVVAQFVPAAALGRLREGQSGEVRLEGFPWAQWGTVPVLVSRVAGEIRDGSVRVELKVDESRPCRIPMEHGMPGAVEVTIEKVTPAELILRTAGRLLSAPRSAHS